ncbi:putative root phototropism protein 2-like [Abeliophyllum distichum]|uniref:Root phototropism protein 2-like n=1 Tax=Abeliophyllum distichum TaxID=126358 RepID=A0ABD1RFK9_9LAMI
MSSSDDESHETNFYTPQGSSIRHFYQTRPDSRVASSVSHSMRTLPKSRLSASSPDRKYAIIPPIKQSTLPSPPPPAKTSSLGPLQASRPALPNIPKRAKFSAPPPPPNIARLQSMNDEEQQASKIPIPPPPPPLPTPRKLGAVETNTPPISKQPIRPQPKSCSPKASPGTEWKSPVKEVESIRRIISGFVEKEKSMAVFNGGDFRDVCSTAMLRVAKIVDAYLGEISTYVDMSISKFNGIANLVPKGGVGG